jgi:hypothetical protein
VPGPVANPDELLLQIVALKHAIDGLRFQVLVIAIGLALALASLILMISAVSNQIIGIIREHSAAVQKTIRESSEIPTFVDK